jgi:FMN phosphatase YigB (HAD superfamily)
LARGVVERAGLDGAEWERAQRERDLDNVTVLGHSATRFPRSCVEALSLVGGDALRDREHVRLEVLNAARSVFRALAPHRAGAEPLLDWLATRGVRIALLTKGDPEVQEGRIAGSGLAHFFDVVSIVPSKSAAEFSHTASELGLRPNEIISVGNSVASDVRPSLEAGIYALWLPAYVWDYEQRHDPAVEGALVQIGGLQEVKDVFR